MSEFLSGFILSFIVTILVTPLTILAAKKYNFLDDPKKRIHPASIHTTPIPRAGGVPIFIAIAIASFVLITHNLALFSILIAGLIVVLTGLLDDKYDISPYIRFLINIFCAGLVVFSGVSIPFVTNPLGGILNFSIFDVTILGFNLAILIPQMLAIIWIVWVMNMLNWSKGVDGQMPGIAAISAIIIGIASLRFPVLESSNIFVATLSFITAGAAVGFLVYNFHPAKIFPGYSATILGFLIGIVSILSSVKLATAILVMGVPTADALITISRRLLAKKSPFWHDRGHLHHLLLAKGWSQTKIAVFYWVMSALLGVLALTLSSRGKLFAIILVLVTAGGLILTLKYVINKQK